MKQLLGDKKIEWLGPKNADDVKQGLWGPYSPLQQYFDDGTIVPISGRLEKIESIAGTGKSKLFLKAADGTISEREAGRTVLAMGMKPNSPQFLKSLAPEFKPEMRTPVLGHDEVFGDASALGGKLKVGDTDHDIYFAGLTSGLTRTEDTSYLEYFGWKNLQLTDQVLAKHIGSNTSPFEQLRKMGQSTSLLGGTSSSAAKVGADAGLGAGADGGRGPTRR